MVPDVEDIINVSCCQYHQCILLPLLFLLYVNDLGANMLHSNVRLYADDTVVFAKHKDERTAHLWVQTDLELLSGWCNRNQLTINLSKTKLILFGTRNILKHGTKADICINNLNLQYVNYLGIRLEDTLTFELLAAETKRMVSHKLYLLARVRKYITIGQSIAMYKSRIVPYFDYGDIFFMNISAKRTCNVNKSVC